MSKNKKNVIRITICIFAFLAVFITGKFVDMNLYASLAIYGAIYVASGYDVLFKAARNIAHGKVFDENFLMTIASLGAFALGIAEGTGDFAESAAVILFYQVGELFQSYAVGKSRQSIASLMDIRPDKARVERNGEKVEVYPEEVTVGESVFVVAGEKIPLDGVVVGGHGNLNTCALTGESAPAFVQAGDEVLSGTIALDGSLEIRVTKEFYDSTASKILDMVENASGKKAKTENFISAFAKYYTPFVVFSAVALAVIPSLVIGFESGFTGELWGEWIKRALTFLVVSCPCALVISIPLGFFGGIGGASSKGILVKGANYIEQLNKTNVIFFDKTGTLTTGEFSVTGVYPEEKKDEILRYASVCESHSTHPIAVGITKAYAATGGTIPEGYEIEEIAGKGIRAKKAGEEIVCGNADLMRAGGVEFEQLKNDKTTVYISINGKFLGAIELSDTVKSDAKQALFDLRKQGVKMAMLTGDNENAAKRVAEELSVDEYHAKLLPQDKLDIVDKAIGSKAPGDVIAFVGDGINDAPVLMRADVGISMGGVGSDSAIEASDVVLMHDKLSDIVTAKKIARKTMRIVKQNIVFALAVKFGVLVLSAFGLLGAYGMWIAVFADVGVAVLAILNAMRAMKVGR